MNGFPDCDDMGLAKEHALQREIDRENRDSAINRAMAEVAGWRPCDNCDCRYWIPPTETHWRQATKLPNFLTDLNAVHEVWKQLPPSKKDMFESHLYGVVIGQAEYNRNDDAPYITNATARQRCEAMLKTYNKWNPEWDYPI